MAESKLDLLQGTLDLMVLQTLASMGPLHGYGIARRIEQVSGDEVLLNQGTIYASLVRLQERGWISAEWELQTIIVRPNFIPLPRTAANNSLRMLRTGSGCPVWWAGFSQCRKAATDEPLVATIIPSSALLSSQHPA